MFLATPAYASAGHGDISHTVFQIGGLNVASEITTMWVVMAVITIVAYLGTRNMQRIPSGLQNFLEFGVEALLNFFSGIMGRKRAKRYLPFLMTFFILILCSNYVGLLPMAGNITGYKPPTSNLSVTAAFALIVIVSSIFFGFQAKGMDYAKSYVKLLPINLLETVTRPLSLALRLYGNIFGEEMTIAVLFSLLPLFLPLPMYALSIMFGAIQAFVFTLLAAIYIEEATGVGH